MLAILVIREKFYKIMNESDFNSFENFIRIFFDNKSRNLKEIESYHNGDRVITADAETWHLYKLQKEVLRKSFIFGRILKSTIRKLSIWLNKTSQEKKTDIC